ncbi:unnamed protein product [Adineta steineri]|uniref:Uncharacterized protein n=2 Tax=Adineta steineri TaxID=433720 RepID=A0A815MJQ4_9BILA|nr:unnamed protein product [Adineta steineri]CAF4063664.1 unnamed protein product [Adineta steineri]
MRSNYLISALSTNMLMGIYNRSHGLGAEDEPIVYPKYEFDTVDLVPKCAEDNPHDKSIFFTMIDVIDLRKHSRWYRLEDDEVPKEDGFNSSGFYAACTPLEALLHCTLDCLYQMECLQVLKKYFPKISESNIDLDASLLLSKPLNLSVENLLLELFIDQDLPQVNYSKYFTQCSPSYCTYTTTDETNISYALTLFISLYGSLIGVLRFIVPLLIQFYFKFRKIVTNRDIRQNLLVHMKETWMKFIRKMKRLNLFKAINERTEEAIQEQRITTRVYLVLLFGSILVFLFYTLFHAETVIRTVHNPTLGKYQELVLLHQKTIRCPCLMISVPHDQFISFYPRFHQICTSDLLDKRWILLLERITKRQLKSDWRSQASSQFKLLTHLCLIARKTVNDSIERFLSESFISADLVNEEEFSIQINITLTQFFQTTKYSLNILNQLTHLLMQVDQPFTGQYFGTKLNVVRDITNDKQPLKINFDLSGTHDIYTRFINCICIENPNCQSSAAIYDRTSFTLISGMKEACFVFDALLLSTLECFYSNSFCYRVLVAEVIGSILTRMNTVPWYAIRPLIYDSVTSSYPPNSSIETILQNLMIEEWNSSYSYEAYYQSCLPTYCIYSEETNKRTLLTIILSLISLIGGLTLVLSIIVPHLVRFIPKRCRSNRQQEQQQVEEDEQQGNSLD